MIAEYAAQPLSIADAHQACCVEDYLQAYRTQANQFLDMPEFSGLKQAYPRALGNKEPVIFVWQRDRPAWKDSRSVLFAPRLVAREMVVEAYGVGSEVRRWIREITADNGTETPVLNLRGRRLTIRMTAAPTDGQFFMPAPTSFSSLFLTSNLTIVVSKHADLLPGILSSLTYYHLPNLQHIRCCLLRTRIRWPDMDPELPVEMNVVASAVPSVQTIEYEIRTSSPIVASLTWRKHPTTSQWNPLPYDFVWQSSSKSLVVRSIACPGNCTVSDLVTSISPALSLVFLSSCDLCVVFDWSTVQVLTAAMLCLVMCRAGNRIRSHVSLSQRVMDDWVVVCGIAIIISALLFVGVS